MTEISMTPVADSANIKAIGYDSADKILAVQFGVNVYHYKDVPLEVFNNFSQSDSKGKFLHANIKGKFEFEKVKNV